MNDYEISLPMALFLVAMAFGFGYVLAFHSVENKCKRLGGFYVSETVYECKVKR